MPRDPLKPYFHDKLVVAMFDPIIPRFVRPNHITVLRFFMTPFVLFFLIREQYAIGIPLFLAAAVTDVLDGSFARIRHEVTTWGKRYDPVADKMLVAPVLILMMFRAMNPYLAASLIALDLGTLIAGALRVMRGEVVMANAWGKAKMFAQVVGLAFLLIATQFQIEEFRLIAHGILGVAFVFGSLSLLWQGV